jgi:predicted dehydrogenase
MSQNKAKIGLVGYGYWGANLLRNMVFNQQSEVVGVVEPRPEGRALCKANFPQLQCFETVEEFLKAAKPQGVVIAVPPAAHFQVATQCLKAGANILVEKPLAMSSADCTAILDEAKKQNRFVMVDHTFVYHPAISYLSDLVKNGSMGDLLYYDSVRVNLGGFQPFTNVLWDLAPHDLSILDLLTKGQVPEKVLAVGVKHFGASVENLCYVHLWYANNFVAHLNLNWAAPVKVRQVTICGTKNMVVYDDNIPVEKVKVYDKGVQLDQLNKNDFRVNYRVGNMVAPVISQKEALGQVIADFIGSILHNKAPVADGQAGQRIVQILEALSKSMEAGGVTVEIAKTSTLRAA